MHGQQPGPASRPDGQPHHRQRQLPDHRHSHRRRDPGDLHDDSRNAAGAGTATVSITVNAVLPMLADAAAQNFTVGTPITPVRFTNSGGGRLTACTVSTPDLPAGLLARPTSDMMHCEIIGTPGNTAAVATYTMTATNAAGPATATVSITVAPPLPDLQNITQAAMLTVNRQAPTITFRNTGGGDIAAGGCAVSPALPMGLTVGRTSGGVSCEIFGTPTAPSTATYMVTATNSAGADASPATVSITVEDAIEPPLLANAGAIIHTVTPRSPPSASSTPAPTRTSAA